MERLQKILAAAGLGSRRACEEIIRQGRVSVNGRIAQVGDSADPLHDAIRVDGARINLKRPRQYIAVYKPVNVICTVSDERGRKTVRDLVPITGKLAPVGRLDADSEGLVLLTDDGELVNRLTHPRYQHEKEYHVYVVGLPNDKALARWRRGINLPDWDERTRDGGRTAPAGVQVLRVERDPQSGKMGAWLQVIMREGRKRQIRRVAQALGLSVRRLIRVRIGSLRLGDLEPGQWRRLTASEIRLLTSDLRPPTSDI